MLSNIFFHHSHFNMKLKQKYVRLNKECQDMEDNPDEKKKFFFFFHMMAAKWDHDKVHDVSACCAAKSHYVMHSCLHVTIPYTVLVT